MATLSNDVIRQLSRMFRESKGSFKGKDILPPIEDIPYDPDDFLVYVPAGGIQARSDLTVHGVMCAVYTITENSDMTTGTVTLEAKGYSLMVYNLSTDPAPGEKYYVSARLRNGLRYITVTTGGGGLVGGCLAENHPGRGVPFDIHLGTWSTADNEWIYDVTGDTKAIDWRFGVPIPEAGATGLFEARESDEYGIIWEVVALDCSSPGECGS